MPSVEPSPSASPSPAAPNPHAAAASLVISVRLCSDPAAAKSAIRSAVDAIFNVKVLKVNTLNRKGKSIRNRKTGKEGSRPNRKRAIVTLVEGSSIDLFKEA